MALFQGFPAASRMFRALMPRPESRFHLIVPGYPGFGQSESPSGETFACAFDHLAEVTDGFPKTRGVREFCIHVFDCGAPIGFKTAMRHPAEIPGIVSQNGNVYQEDLGRKREARAEYRKNPTQELREQRKGAFAPDTVMEPRAFGTEEGRFPRTAAVWICARHPPCPIMPKSSPI